MKKSGIVVLLVLGIGLIFTVIFLNDAEPVADSRFIEPDKLYNTFEGNIQAEKDYEVIVDIDHARLAQKAGSPMPPAHVLIWSDPKLETEILKHNPMAAVDLPLRILAFEDSVTGKGKVIANSFDFIMNRHALPETRALRERYETAMSKATHGIPDKKIASFESNTMVENGLITLDSPYDFNKTESLVIDAINSQNDTIIFATVDFSERAKKFDVSLAPMRLILFGAPGPGGKAMNNSPSLGLDAFCQKMLIWQDATGAVYATFNDLLILAEHQKLSGGIPLRVINYRINKTFSSVLEK